MDDFVKVLMEKSKILVVVPMKGLQESKSRLRQSFSNETQSLISELVQNLYLNTISSLCEIKIDFAVVSPSEPILDLAEKNNSSFIFKDTGLDLNLALHSAIKHAFNLDKWLYVFILTADLPFLDKESIEGLFRDFSPDTLTILPAPLKADGTRGTSGIFMPIDLAYNFKLCFGHNSYFKFKEQLKGDRTWNEYNNGQLGFDLDDLNDLYYLVSKETKKNQGSELISAILNTLLP